MLQLHCSARAFCWQRQPADAATCSPQVAKLQRACLRNPVKVEVTSKYSTVDTLRQQYLFIPAKHKVLCWDAA